MMPIISEQEAAFFERAFRGQTTDAPRNHGRKRPFLHAAAPGTSGTRKAQKPSNILQLRGRGNFESSGTFRVFCGCGAGSKLSFQAICRSRSGPSCRFERFSEAEQGQAGSSGHFLKFSSIFASFKLFLNFSELGSKAPERVPSRICEI